MRNEGEVGALVALDRGPDEIRKDHIDRARLQRDLTGAGIGHIADLHLDQMFLVDPGRLHRSDLPCRGSGRLQAEFDGLGGGGKG